MSIFDFFRRAPQPSPPQAQIFGDGMVFEDLKDPRLAAFLAAGTRSSSGVTVNADAAMTNTAVFRCVSLISFAMGMLPLHLIREETKKKADDHPLFRVLHREPNNWQTAFDFRSLMQLRALVNGNAYALIVRSRGQVIRLVPLDPNRVTPVQNADWSVSYRYNAPGGGHRDLAPEEVFHLRGLSMDGISGISLVQQARDVIGLALAADLAIGRVFKNGAFVDGSLVLPPGGKLSPEQIERLRETWAERYSGSGNAGKTPLLEEGLEYKVSSSSPKDAQFHETRGRQVEEIARVFGVPRPLLFVDETSWGSGIDVLGQFFVRYGLNPWFEAWQQAIERSLLVGREKDELSAKFNAGALLRGSMKDQGEFFARALGSGGHRPWMTANEVRDMLDMPEHEDGSGLAVAPPSENQNEPAPTT
ncbi:phage portal protein [Chelatococcus sp.]|uniref:phage portal protein n=1 Tax=Chelatococcus sp. TaxID=1953771 RepID=UPI0025B8F878|nr:phage portal protein [Chelatococcus sp.]